MTLSDLDSSSSRSKDLAKGSVAIWTTDLEVASETRRELCSVLSQEELERAERFHFDIHRNRYITGRAFLRFILSEYLEIPASDLQFELGPQGKPALTSPFGLTEIQFNLSHSETVAVLAITRAGAVGVDVEKVRHLREFDELVNRFFSVNEAEKFTALSSSQKPGAFFNLWTRKEAWLKATGEGIAHRLKEVEVSFLDHEPVRFLTLPQTDAESSRSDWALHDFSPAPGYTAALAIAATEVRLIHHTWTPNRPINSEVPSHIF